MKVEMQEKNTIRNEAGNEVGEILGNNDNDQCNVDKFDYP